MYVCPWRVEGEQSRDTELYVTKAMPKEEMDRILDSLDTFSVIAFTASGFAPLFKDIQQTTMSELVEVASSDPEMIEAAARLRLPVERTHATFGTMKLDRRIGTFEADLLCAGGRVVLTVDAVKDEPNASHLEVAESIWSDFSGFDDRARRTAARELLTLKNESWLDDDNEQEITETEFRRRMKLTYISITDQSDITFGYNDGGLFHGHTIQVSGSLDSGFSDAEICG
jgi:hypothetical protein